MPDDSFEPTDNQQQRAREDLRMLGIPSVGSLSGVLDDVILHASDPARRDGAGLVWQALGPRNIGGRIRALAQDPANANTLYAGSAIGGLWKTVDAGDTWVALDNYPRPGGAGHARQALPIGAIAVAQRNTQVIYVGTGEAVGPQGVIAGAQSADYPAGVGLLRSEDGGVSFTIIAPVDAAPIRAQRFEKLLVDPWDPDRVWIACPTGLWRRETGGISQDVIDAGAPAPQNVVDIAIDFGDRTAPAAPARFTVYAAIQADGIYRATFNRAAAGYDAVGGVTWTRLSAGINEPAAPGRIRVALCERSPQVVYAMFERPGAVVSPLYRSTDGGNQFAAATTPPERASIAWYAFLFGVHPEHPEIVFVGIMDLFRTSDSGATWQKVIDWNQYAQVDRAQHADQHAIAFDGLDPRKIWVGNDGGVSMSRDLGNTWRKRSHGILAAQFNDITVHPAWPFVMGGGLQDNGDWVGFGGTTWYYVMQADGGAIGFVPNSLVDYYVTWQGATARATLTYYVPPPPPAPPAVAPPPPPPAAPPPPLAFLAFMNPPNPDHWVNFVPDLAAPGGQVPRLLSWVWALNPNIGGTGPFVGVLEAHPSTPNEYLVGWTGGLFRTIDGTAFTRETPPGVLAAGATLREVTCIAYAPSAPNTNWWIGTEDGRVFVTTTGTGGFGAAPVAIPGFPAGQYVTDAVVHPTNPAIVVVATNGNPGRIFLTGDNGATWTEISGNVGAPNGVAAASATDQLPTGPYICVAFDPGCPTDVRGAQTLYVGTLAGIYVSRNVVAPAAAEVGHPGPAVPVWRAMNEGLPLVRTNDIAPVAWRDGGGTLVRSALRCATMGRGIYECNLLAAPPVELLIRDTAFDDGRVYPGMAAMTCDPRQPGGPAPRLDQAYDIRVDAPPFSFFDETMDPAEFDEALVNDVAVAGERNLVYVQIQQNGVRTGVNDAKVNLYCANSPGAPPALDAGFWDAFPDGDPPAGALWQRAAPQKTTRDLSSGQPEVLRFEWTPPADADAQMALLALATHANDDLKNPVPTLTVDPAIAPNLIADRRAAVRLVTVQPFTPEVFVRDGADDSGDSGAVAWGGRSADIIPSETDIGNPDDEFKDIADLRTGDTLVGGRKNYLYVRVHNRKNVTLNADVELYRVPYATLHQPATWQKIGATVSVDDVPAKGWKFAPPIEWDGPPPEDPGPPRVHLLVALITRPGDSKPNTNSINSLETFWRYFVEGAPANNAAFRALRWRS